MEISQDQGGIGTDPWISKSITESVLKTKIFLGLNGISGSPVSGTIIGANPTSASLNFIDYQVNNVDTFKVDLNGLVSIGGATPSTSTNLMTPASTTAISSIRVPHGVSPTTPVNGDLWSTTTGFYGRVNGASVLFNTSSATIAGSIAADQVAYGSGANTIQASAGVTYPLISGQNVFRINANSSNVIQALPTGTLSIITGADGTDARFLVGSYGTGNKTAISGRHARGTNASPSATQSGDVMSEYGSWGYGATGFSSAPRAMIQLYAAENWTDTVQGTRLSFYTTAPGGIVTSEKMRIWGDGGVQIGGTYTASNGAGVFTLGNAPISSATSCLFNLSNTALSGASISGTYMGANPLSASADFINYQVGNVTGFLVDKSGALYLKQITGYTGSYLSVGNNPGVTNMEIDRYQNISMSQLTNGSGYNTGTINWNINHGLGLGSQIGSSLSIYFSEAMMPNNSHVKCWSYRTNGGWTFGSDNFGISALEILTSDTSPRIYTRMNHGIGVVPDLSSQGMIFTAADATKGLTIRRNGTQVVTGSLTPNATGTYTCKSNLANGVYFANGTSYYIYKVSNTWYMSATLGATTGAYWTSSLPSGAFSPQGTATGTATITPNATQTANLFEVQCLCTTPIVSISSTGGLSLLTDPVSSATQSLLQLGLNAISGGSSSGTFLSANPASASADFANYQVNNVTKFKVDSGGNTIVQTLKFPDSSTFTTAALAQTIGVDIGDGVNLIAGTPFAWVRVPFACTIVSVTVIADTSASAVVDVLKCAFGSWPTVASITASAKPTISGATSSEDTTLTGWTNSISAGDIIKFSVISVSGAKKLTVQLKTTRT